VSHSKRDLAATGRPGSPDPLPGHALIGLLEANAVVSAAATRRMVIANADGSHMGPAVNWWEADVAARQSHPETPGARLDDAREDVLAAMDTDEALRSAVEVICSMVAWIARNDHESHGDHGVRILTGLSGESLLLPSQRILCADLAEALSTDPQRSDFAIHRVDVASAMRLLVFLSRAIEQRFEVSVAKQIDTFRRTILALAAGGDTW
jgi:hypothetical protein